MTINLILNTLAICLATIILWRTEPALARMGSATRWSIRYAMLLLAGGALGVILTIANGAQVDFPTLFVLAGLTLLLLNERRLNYRLNPPGDNSHA